MREAAMADVVHWIVSGRVQGVGFREFTRRAALRLGIAGWVRNLPGGEVELLARIPPGRKAAFLAELRRGPSLSSVTGVVEAPAASGEDCPDAGFEVRF
jgi:acylphosphatase